MDLNHLLYREGIERLRAAAARCAASRYAHLGLADLYRDRISVHRRAAIVAAAPRPALVAIS